MPPEEVAELRKMTHLCSPTNFQRWSFPPRVPPCVPPRLPNRAERVIVHTSKLNLLLISFFIQTVATSADYFSGSGLATAERST